MSFEKRDKGLWINRKETLMIVQTGNWFTLFRADWTEVTGAADLKSLKGIANTFNF